MPFARQAATIASFTIGNFSRPLSHAMMKAPSTPTPALSVAVAQPAKIDPSTTTMRNVIGNRPRPHGAPEFAARLRSVVGRELRRPLRLDDRDRQDVDEIEAGEHETRHGRGGEQRAGRRVEHLGHHHQHDGRRNEDAERPGRCDGADGEPLVVAGVQHLRQRDEGEQHDRGPDHADRSREDRAHHHHGDGKRARNPLQQDFGRQQHVPAPSRSARGSFP